MKAITIWQPWASLIAIGSKKYETRSWKTDYRGPIAIHAAEKDTFKILINTDSDTLKAMSKALFGHPFYQINAELCKLPKGKIIATAELVGCWEICVDGGDNGWAYMPTLDNSYHATEQEMMFGDWTPGRYAWEIANIKILDKPIPAKGQQRLWNWEGK